MSERDITAGSVGRAWLAACDTLLAAREHKLTHVVVRMPQPLPDDPAIRSAADDFMDAAGHAPIDEVRNTIFPAEMAAVIPDPIDLATAYLEDYALRSQLAGGYGTYFGRICEYPHPSGPPTPQLANVVGKLRQAHAGKRWRATYQLNIYAEHADFEKRRPFFPCMAHLGFHLSTEPGRGKPDRLDCIALYRNQNMTLKAYGNFLGLAELQQYLAIATGFRPGALTVVAGHAEMELRRGDRDRLRVLIGNHLVDPA